MIQASTIIQIKTEQILTRFTLLGGGGAKNMIITEEQRIRLASLEKRDNKSRAKNQTGITRMGMQLPLTVSLDSSQLRQHPRSFFFPLLPLFAVLCSKHIERDLHFFPLLPVFAVLYSKHRETLISSRL